MTIHIYRCNACQTAHIYTLDERLRIQKAYDKKYGIGKTPEDAEPCPCGGYYERFVQCEMEDIR